MSRYQHKKGKIQDNALEALLHDPLFRQRVEKNRKGKGSFCRKAKYGKGSDWETSGKSSVNALPLVSCIKEAVNYALLFCALSRSRISVSNVSSALGFGGSAGFSSCERRSLFISLMARKMANATMMKSNTF